MFPRIIKAIAILLSVYLVGCGSGSSGSSGNNPNGSGSSGSGGNNSNGSISRQILAKNVLLSSAHASLADKSVSKKELDTTSTVTAGNVVIDTAGNSLTSTNLQDALDKEMAINLSKILPGTTWTVINKTNDPAYKGLQGRVSFLADTLTIDEGVFAAAGLFKDFGVYGNPCSAPISYEILDNSVMYVSWTQCDGDAKSAVITIFAKKLRTMSTVGDGGQGGIQGISRISILTKVQ